MKGRVVIAAAALAVVATLVVAVATRESSRFVGANTEEIQLDAGVRLVPGARGCQRGETVPARARRLALDVSSGGRPAGPLRVTVTDPRARALSSGTSRAGFVDGRVTVAMRPLPRGAQDATVCVRNAGQRPVAVLGARSAPEHAARLSRGRNARRSMIRLAWFSGSGSTSGFDRLSTIVDRAGLVKASFFGAWTIWTAFVLLALAGIAAVAAVVREARP